MDFTSARKLFVTVSAALLFLVVNAVAGHATCDPTTDPDKTDIANARTAVAVNCDCAGATSHGAYVSCAAQQANTVLINKSCAGFVKKCASHSICGKPAGAVTCCNTTTKGTKCKIKQDAAHCTAKQGTVGACTSCCDSCPTPGPLCTRTTTTATTFHCTTTTVPLCGSGPSPPFTCDSSFARCPGGQTCQTQGSGACSCVGPTPTCDNAGVPFCSVGTCPAGQSCQTVCSPDGLTVSCQCF